VDLSPERLRAVVGAEAPGPEEDPSFWVEASNYLQHHLAKDLPRHSQEKIVRRLRDLSMVFSGRSGAGDVRRIIFWLCEDRHSSCDLAAERLLEWDEEQLKELLKREGESGAQEGFMAGS